MSSVQNWLVHLFKMQNWYILSTYHRNLVFVSHSCRVRVSSQSKRSFTPQLYLNYRNCPAKKRTEKKLTTDFTLYSHFEFFIRWVALDTHINLGMWHHKWHGIRVIFLRILSFVTGFLGWYLWWNTVLISSFIVISHTYVKP